MNLTLLRLIVGQICLHAFMTGMRMAMPLYALRLGHSASEVGIIISLFALSNVMMALPWGKLADRYGLHGPWLGAVAMAALGACLAAAFPRFEVFCLTSLLAGGSMGLGLVAVQRRACLMPEQKIEHQRRAMWGWLTLAAPTANLVGPALVGLVLDHAGAAPQDRVAFAWACLSIGVLAMTSWFWIRGVSAAPAATAPIQQVPQSKRELIRDKRLQRLLVVSWATASCWDVHAFVVPLLGHERGFSASMIGFILASFALAAAVIRPLLPRLTAGIPERAFMTGALACTATLLALYPLIHHPWLAILNSALLGITLGSVQPMLLSTLQQITPTDRLGQAMSMRLMMISVSSVITPLLFGSFGAMIGLSAVFGAVSLIAALGSGTAFTLRAHPTAPHHIQ